MRLALIWVPRSARPKPRLNWAADGIQDHDQEEEEEEVTGEEAMDGVVELQWDGDKVSELKENDESSP